MSLIQKIRNKKRSSNVTCDDIIHANERMDADLKSRIAKSSSVLENDGRWWLMMVDDGTVINKDNTLLSVASEHELAEINLQTLIKIYRSKWNKKLGHTRQHASGKP